MDVRRDRKAYMAPAAAQNYVAYRWDAENRLHEVEPLARESGNVIPSAYRKVAFDYDYRGRRIEKRVYRRDGTTTTQWDADPLERRRFVWNGWLTVMETIETDANTDGDVADGGDSTRVKKYTWGRDIAGGHEVAGGIGGLLAVFDDNSTSTDINLIYCYDANGNVGQLVEPVETTAAAGIDAKYEYDVYGNVTSSGGPYAPANTFRFSTKFWDDVTGLGYWGYRHYDTRVGRWINRDPIGEGGGLGLYAAVANLPVSRIDALGLEVLTNADARALCQSAIDRKYAASAQFERDKPTLSDQDHKSCESMKNSILQNVVRRQRHSGDPWDLKPEDMNSSRLRHYWNAINENCTPPSVVCKCCPSGSLGSYSPSTHTITLCANNLKGADPQKAMEDTLIHESVHALQRCLAPTRSGCVHSLEDELVAYLCEGACNDFDSCLRRAIGSSCGGHCQSAENLPDALLDELRAWFIRNKDKLCTFPREPDFPKPKSQK